MTTQPEPGLIARDQDYFARRAAEARRAACSKEAGEDVAVSGELALAFAALARRSAARNP